MVNIMLIILEIGYSVQDYKTKQYQDVAADFVMLIFVEGPQLTMYALSSLIFLKYHFYLVYLNGQMRDNGDGCNFAKIAKEYKLLIKSWNNEYYLTPLYWSIMLWMLQLIGTAWQNTHYLTAVIRDIDDNELGLFWPIVADLKGLAIVFVFGVGAFAMTESFKKFEYEMYEYGESFMEYKNGSINGSDKYYNDSWEYSYLLQYMNKYPLVIRFGKITFTKMNAVSFVITFIIIKFLSYSMEYIY